MIEKALTKKLLAMAEADQTMRTQSVDDISRWDSSLDKLHTKQLKRIISRYGWPKISLVGIDVSNAAWLLVQHADHDLEFQEECLRIIKALPKDEILQSNVAYLEDRVRIAKGMPQR